jgi:hypothetical protein
MNEQGNVNYQAPIKGTDRFKEGAKELLIGIEMSGIFRRGFG